MVTTTRQVSLNFKSGKVVTTYKNKTHTYTRGKDGVVSVGETLEWHILGFCRKVSRHEGQRESCGIMY